MNALKNFFLPFFLLCLNLPGSFSQDAPELDVATYAANFDQPFENVASLAHQLTAPFQTEAEKAEVIFLWIAHNVRYDCKKFHQQKRPEITARSKEELERKILEFRQGEIEKTAKYKKGICEDYSRLFKALCDHAGLEAVVVTGNARDFYKPYRSAHNNPHAWNAVKIDGQWHLLDATWAAGYTDPEVSKFTRKLSAGYFKTPPAWFAQNHFPDDPDWQLLEKPLDKNAFSRQPLINFGESEFVIEDFSWEVKTVQGNGHDREIRIKFREAPPYFFLATRKSKLIPFAHQHEDGYEVFRFSGRGNSDVTIFGGKAKQGRQGWLAQYDL